MLKILKNMFIYWFHKNSRDRLQVIPISIMDKIIIINNKLTFIYEITARINKFFYKVFWVFRKKIEQII